MVEGLEEAQSRLQSRQDRGLWGHLKHRWVVLAFALNIDGDPNHDLDLEFVGPVDDPRGQESRFVIGNDNHAGALFEQVALLLLFLVSLLQFFLIFFLFLLDSAFREVELHTDLLLDAQLVSDRLPQLFDLGRGLQLD